MQDSLFWIFPRPSSKNFCMVTSNPCMEGDKATVLYTDTDSLILEIFTENFYDDIKENIQYFDTSHYAVNNIYNMPKTASVVEKMKEEYAGRPIRVLL